MALLPHAHTRTPAPALIDTNAAAHQPLLFHQYRSWQVEGKNESGSRFTVKAEEEE